MENSEVFLKKMTGNTGLGGSEFGNDESHSWMKNVELPSCNGIYLVGWMVRAEKFLSFSR